MPNTLAHLGVQGLATRALIRNADLKWVYLGCVVPDVPWILQRLVKAAAPSVAPYDLRLYCIVQASLVFCLLLSSALALLSVHFRRIFTILSINAALHLLLDACQTKWGNGVHFMAPLNWQLTNLGLFWPESLPTYFLTCFGLAYVIFYWLSGHTEMPVDGSRLSAKRCLSALILIFAYFFLPFFLLSGPEAADNHCIRTLRHRDDREGLPIEIDRGFFVSSRLGGTVRTFAGEDLLIEGMTMHAPATVSVRGTFIAKDRIRISDYHVHNDWIRDASSYLGLGFVALLWISKWLKGKPVRKILTLCRFRKS